MSATANGFLERSIPVVAVYSTKASVINRMLEVDAEDVEDASWLVDDMRATNDCSVWSEKKERGSRQRA